MIRIFEQLCTLRIELCCIRHADHSFSPRGFTGGILADISRGERPGLRVEIEFTPPSGMRQAILWPDCRSGAQDDKRAADRWPDGRRAGSIGSFPLARADDLDRAIATALLPRSKRVPRRSRRVSADPDRCRAHYEIPHGHGSSPRELLCVSVGSDSIGTASADSSMATNSGAAQAIEAPPYAAAPTKKLANDSSPDWLYVHSSPTLVPLHFCPRSDGR